MLAQRWSRLLTGRSPLVLLAVLALLVGVVILFSNLAIERSAATAEFEQAQARLTQLGEQNARLRAEVAQAEGGQQVVPWAYRLFRLAPAGTTVVEGQAEVPAAATEPAAANQPFWQRWWNKLR